MVNLEIRVSQEPIICSLKELAPVELERVTTKETASLWKHLVSSYHYLGYTKMFGPRIQYLIFSNQTILGAISFNHGALKLGARDQFIGWDATLKKEQLHRIVCNNRFLILPWVRVPNLASHVLAKSLHLLRDDWQRAYAVCPVLVETFVDRARFTGTCYKAAGWQEVGITRGYAKVGPSYQYHGQIKRVFIQILEKHFRRTLHIPEHMPPHKSLKRRSSMNCVYPEYDPQLLEDLGVTAETCDQLNALLENYLNSYQPCYNRTTQKVLVNTIITGMLSDLKRKSIEPIALRYGGEKGVRNLQMFFKHATFNDQEMLNIYQHNLAHLIGGPEGIITIDGSDFPKKGKNSVGVTRQYCGNLGKIENCQAGVFLGYACNKQYALINRKLYMPKHWFDESHSHLRKACAVPQELKFITKNELAIQMLNEVVEQGVLPVQWVLMDAAFGCDRKVLEAVPSDCYYFADVRNRELVFLSVPEMTLPSDRPRGRPHTHPRPSLAPVSVETYALDDSIPWQTVVLDEGTKGPIISEIKCIRGVYCHSTTKQGNYLAPKESIWIYIRKLTDGRIKYSLSNAPEDTPLETLNRIAVSRWSIEQCFQECKSYLGMGHYEARSYKAWHRHMLFVMMAHAFLLLVRNTVKKNR